MSTTSELLPKIEALFYEKSFSDLSMDEIAAALGMKKASLYYHFPSKEAMFSAILDRSFELCRTETLFRIEATPNELLREMVEHASSSRNLFSIAAQKGYCRIEAIRQKISERKASLRKECVERLRERFGWNAERAEVFITLTDALSQRRCSENVTEPLPESLVSEISILFSL